MKSRLDAVTSDGSGSRAGGITHSFIIEQGEELNAMLKAYVPMGRLGRPEEIADAVLWL